MNTATRLHAAALPAAASPAPTSSSPPADLKAWVVKATGVLLVIPALLNAGYDIYASALKLPRTDAEKVNTELFKKYFNKEPLARLPVPIKNSFGTMEAKFAIYEEGEIYVEYGQYSQWFPFPRTDQPRRVSMSLISQAYAEPAPEKPATTQARIASQTESIIGATLVRSRVYADGKTERREIDIRTGSTLNVEFGRISKEQVPHQTSPSQLIKMDLIDLQQLRVNQQGK